MQRNTSKKNLKYFSALNKNWGTEIYVPQKIQKGNTYVNLLFLQKNPEEDHDLVIMQWPQEQYTKDQNAAGETTPDRSSPPLYEVELTASDEDDDASVLELVIPMHSSRYQRVPTSSPKKSKPKVVKRYFCSMICCGRK